MKKILFIVLSLGVLMPAYGSPINVTDENLFPVGASNTSYNLHTLTPTGFTVVKAPDGMVGTVGTDQNGKIHFLRLNALNKNQNDQQSYIPFSPVRYSYRKIITIPIALLTLYGGYSLIRAIVRKFSKKPKQLPEKS